MPQGKDFIFFLQDKQNRFWGLDSSKDIVLNANPYPLDYSPAGWEETTIKNVRNKKYWAVDRSVSNGFKYVEDAAKIMKYIFSQKGPEETVYLCICEQKLRYEPGVGYGYWYKLLYKSEIDLSTYEHAGAYVQANCLEDGFAKHLKANENTVYEIPIDDNAIYVKEDGIILAENAKYQALDGLEIPKSLYGLLFTVPLTFLAKDGSNSPIAFFDSPLTDLVGAGLTLVEDIVNSSYNFAQLPLTFTSSLSLRIQGTLKITCISNDPDAGYKIRLLKTGQTSSNQDDYVIVPADSLVPGSTYTKDIDITLTVDPGDKLFMEWVYIMSNPSAVGVNVKFEPDSDLSMTYTYRYKESYIKCLRPLFIFNELIMRMSGNEYSSDDCPYFGELKNWDKVFTSGDGIRGIDGSVLKISFSMFFDFWNTYDAVGIREKNKKITLDRKATLTDGTNFIDMGTVSNLKVGFDKTWPFNEMSIGYPDVKNENGMINGKNEVNTTFNYSIGTTKTPRKEEKVSKIRVSCYDIENTRIEGQNKNTTDNKNDNELYAMHISSTLVPADGDIPAHYELNRSYNAFVSGVDQPGSVFNLSLSPKNCMLNGGDYYRSCFYKGDNLKLKFVSADRNKNMVYSNSPVFIAESGDEVIGDFAAPFFTPTTLTIDVDVPDDLLDQLDQNPAAGLQFTFEGNVYKGVSLENSINPKTDKAQTFTILSHPDNDLTKLVSYYG